MRKINVIFAFLMIFGMILHFFQNKNNVFALKNAENEVSAESMITIESTTGRVLYKKDENKRLPMASTTKIITAIVAIENCINLDTKHTITKEMTGIEGSSIYLRSGEKLSVRDLLYGLMLRSGNDSAVAIATIVAGSVQKFVQLMNDFCLSLGLTNTHIVTVNGLHDDNHFSSASDLAKVTAYALKNKTFAEIVKTKEKTILCDGNKDSKYRFLKNKNKLLKMVDGADGVKTGYTKKAGKCFVGSATRNGMQVISVVLNAKSMFDESAHFIEKAFLEYRLVKLFKAGEIAKIDESVKTQNCSIYLKNDIIYPLSKEEVSKINAKVNIFDKINKNAQIGTLDFRIENDLLFSTELYTIIIDNNGSKNSFSNRLNRIIKAF